MKKIFSILHLLIIAMGYSIFCNRWVSPSVTPIFEYLALFFLPLLALHIIFLLLWLLVDRRRFLVLAFLGAGFLIPLNRIYHLYGGEDSNKANITFGSYNIREYSYDEKDQIPKLLAEKHPDILFLQEIPLREKNRLENLYPYQEQYGSIGIFSIYPIVESNQLKANGEKIRACYADIKIKNDTLRAINLHLSSTKIDKKQISKVKDATNTQEVKEGVKKVAKNLFLAFEQHQKQINEVRKVMDKTPYPLIVGGDFNAVPSSYEYYKVKKGMEDTFEQAGKGAGATFYDYRIPIKIDHIFVSSAIRTTSVSIEKVKYSDHYPIFITFHYNFKNKLYL